MENIEISFPQINIKPIIDKSTTSLIHEIGIVTIVINNHMAII